MTASESAAAYLERGWAVVPLDRDDKRPVIKDWPELAHKRAFTPDDFEDCNVGVVLGTTSGDLVDIDLDSRAAMALAPYFLPSTLTFGRPAKPASHWLFISPGVRSHKLRFSAPEEWRFDPEQETQLIEVRSTNAATDVCGSQTAFPGSVHSGGELVAFDSGQTDPAEIVAGELLWAVCRLAVASIILHRYEEGKGRNEQTLGLAGGLLKAGWTGDEVTQLFDAVRECSGDDRPKDASAVERTIEQYANGQDVTGFGSLIESGVLDEHTLAEITKHARTPEQRRRDVTLARTRMGAGLREQMIAEARLTDGMTAAYSLVAARPTGAAGITRDAESEPPADRASAGEPLAFDAYGLDVDTQNEPEPLDYFWGPFAPGKVSGVLGFANAGKSPFLQSMLLHSAMGIPKFCGMPISKQRCALLDFETGRLAEVRLRRLARGLGRDVPPPAPEFRMKHMGEELGPELLEALDEWIRAHDIGVIGVDTYGAAIGAVDHNSPDFSFWLKQLGQLSNNTGALVIVLMHEKKTELGKRKGSALEMISGHGSAPGAIQGAVSLYHPDEDDVSRVTVHCARAPEEGFETFDIQWSDVKNPKSAGVSAVGAAIGARWGLGFEMVERLKAGKIKAGESESAQVEAATPKVLDLVNAQAPDGTPMLWSDVAAAVQGNRAVVGMAIDALVKAGRLSGDYLIGSPPSRAKPRHIWLPRRKKSIAGTIQG